MVATETGARDVAKGLKNPAMRRSVKRRVVHVIQQRRHGGHSLLFGEHAGLRQTARGTLAHLGRRVILENIEERLDGIVRAKVCQAFDGPIPCSRGLRPATRRQTRSWPGPVCSRPRNGG